MKKKKNDQSLEKKEVIEIKPSNSGDGFSRGEHSHTWSNNNMHFSLLCTFLLSQFPPRGHPVILCFSAFPRN